MAGSNIKFFWRCEGTTLDATHDKTAGDSTATMNSLAAIAAGAAKIGSNGLDVPSSNDHAKFAVSSGDLISSSLGSFGFWFRIATFGADASLFKAINTAASTNRIMIVMIGTNTANGRELRFNINLAGGINVNLDTTAADLDLNTWYFVVARYDEPNSDRRLEVYNEDGSLRTSVENLTTNFDVPSGINEIDIGEAEANACSVDLDNIFIADVYGEALQDKMNITSFTEYDGAAPSTPAFRLSLLGVGR